ncbi:MAG TPA: dihydroorotase [Saprospiraceae bacterium]|nr:dihydroorotase [Saprospiraceae bacterium]
MNILLQKAHIVDGSRESKPQDILIRNGRIESISSHIEAEKNTKVWSSPHLCVSPGWFDVGVQTGDPGFEHREDLRTVAAAAAKGGFTAIAPFPNTQPAIHSKSEILYIRNTTAGLGVHFYPIGAVSLECAGKDLAELYDMHASGAVAFSDGKKSVQDAGLLLRAMQYTRAFNGLILNEPHHKTIASGGQMHEGTMSTSLGLKGLPSLAEEIMVQRDLSLLEYSEGRLHIHLISTAKSVDMIRAAKKAGLQVTCSVAVANLFFTDAELRDFDSNWKLLPPLRAQSDADALIEGLADGTIDFIVSNHSPWDEEAKNLEFPYADFGMIGLETVFALCRTFGDKKLPLPLLVEKLSLAPRRIFGLPVPEIKEGEKAELTVFDPTESYTFSVENIGSKSRNTPFLGRKMQGKVLGTIV